MRGVGWVGGGTDLCRLAIWARTWASTLVGSCTASVPSTRIRLAIRTARKKQLHHLAICTARKNTTASFGHPHYNGKHNRIIWTSALQGKTQPHHLDIRTARENTTTSFGYPHCKGKHIHIIWLSHCKGKHNHIIWLSALQRKTQPHHLAIRTARENTTTSFGCLNWK